MAFLDYKIIEEIKYGWSNEKKYKVEKDNVFYFMRVNNLNKLDDLKQEYEMMCKVKEIGISTNIEVEFGIYEDKVYSVWSWVDGELLENRINDFSKEKQYEYGLIAGRYLKRIHSIEAKENITSYKEKFNTKLNKKIKAYNECELKLKKEKLFLDYIDKNRSLIQDEKQVFHHGDYHIGNMMLDKNDNLVIIDYNRYDFGEPYAEFNRMIWNAKASKYFASGLVDGYFENNIPLDFWKKLLLYLACNMISSLPWAIPFGEEEVEIMKKQEDDILSWYNDFKSIIPSWYTKL